MTTRIFKATLSVLLATAFIGCGGPKAEPTATRFERKKAEWARQQVEAEERFAELAQRMPARQREAWRRELQNEFDAGRRDLERGSLR